MRINLMTKLVNGIIAIVCIAVTAVIGSAQQPFITDNADVTAKGHWHVEFADEFDRLPVSALPIDFQNAFRASLSYGLVKDLEVSINGQHLSLLSKEDPRLVAGFGDTSLDAKYNFWKERSGSLIPALAVTGSVRLATGNARNGLGSGVVAYGINGIAQKSFGDKNVVRVNTGYLFTGNTVVGSLGITVDRGHVHTASASYTRNVSKKLLLGAEIAGAVTGNFRLNAGQLQTQFGGNYSIGKKTTLDFGFILGKFAASPRQGILIGLSHDF